ncbi:hypothetical protein [Cupriavidus sp. EM10]|uniref:hypothetical protein n=1 Tax=Cupriavidus sp. EM10 TaxID=2839983 RepID=UPI001C0088D3|nr:hypothetical protein [Cupriavidus sp. EM10]QWE95664.1 hypothetical protein KLP38_07445 [Cupriavidus sp. EM10]
MSAGSITGTLPIANGGTNATTAAAARTNLAVPGLAAANTFTANQAVSLTTPSIILNDSSGASFSNLTYQSNGAVVWTMTKSSANNFNLSRYVAGSFVDNPISCTNAAGVCTLTQRPVFGSATPWDSANLSFASPPAIGATTPAAGTFTTLSSTGNAKVIATTVGPQSLPSGANTTITGWVETLDATNSFNNTTGVFTVPAAGTYMVTTQVRMIGVTWAVGNLYQIVLSRNGSLAQASIKNLITAGTYTIDDHITFLVNCAVNDTLTLGISHNGTGAGAIDTNANVNTIGIVRIP